MFKRTCITTRTCISCLASIQIILNHGIILILGVELFTAVKLATYTSSCLTSIHQMSSIKTGTADTELTISGVDGSVT